MRCILLCSFFSFRLSSLTSLSFFIHVLSASGRFIWVSFSCFCDFNRPQQSASVAFSCDLQRRSRTKKIHFLRSSKGAEIWAAVWSVTSVFGMKLKFVCLCVLFIVWCSLHVYYKRRESVDRIAEKRVSLSLCSVFIGWCECQEPYINLHIVQFPINVK